MREAERREAAAIEYAQAIENKRKLDQERFQKIDSDYTKKFEESVKKWNGNGSKTIGPSH